MRLPKRSGYHEHGCFRVRRRVVRCSRRLAILKWEPRTRSIEPGLCPRGPALATPRRLRITERPVPSKKKAKPELHCEPSGAKASGQAAWRTAPGGARRVVEQQSEQRSRCSPAITTPGVRLSLAFCVMLDHRAKAAWAAAMVH